MINKSIAIYAFIQAISIGSTALAGWSSGGGHLRTDGDNPWFIQNTADVRYCVKIDEENFGQTLTGTKKAIRDAINYWQGEFSIAESVETFIKLGTQKFTDVSCDLNPDVVFQFGVLDEVQEHFIGDASKVVGIAVRTNYDTINLRGRGFIYIAPELGRLSLQGTGLLPNRWSTHNGTILKLALIHELGHVFGVPHSGGIWSVMGDGFSDAIVRKSYGEFFATALKVGSFFTFPTNVILNTCGDHDQDDLTSQILQIPRNWRCLQVKAIKTGYQQTYEISAAQDRESPWHVQGTIKTGEMSGYGSEIGVLILPAEQTVVPNNDLQRYSLYSQVHRKEMGVFTNVSGDFERSVLLELSPRGFSLSANNDAGKLHLDILQLETWQVPPYIHGQSNGLSISNFKKNPAQIFRTLGR